MKSVSGVLWLRTLNHSIDIPDLVVQFSLTDAVSDVDTLQTQLLPHPLFGLGLAKTNTLLTTLAYHRQNTDDVDFV
jgi:hypothetical protein